MIIKGKSRGNGGQLGPYLLTPGQNEDIRVVEIRGVSATNVPAAVVEMDALAQGARTKKSLYHASINTPPDERLTDEQRIIAADRLEAALGLAGQPRVIVVHEKKGRVHCHVVWSRIDLDRMAAISDSNNFAKHEAVARELEREFGLRRVQGVHAEREGKARPKRTPSYGEMQQSVRSGLTPQEVTAKVTEIWRGTKTGSAFAIALWENGFVLARGDRRDFVIVDPYGEIHSLARRIEGARVKDVRARMADLDPAYLPSITEARKMQRDRLARQTERGDGISQGRARDKAAPEANPGRSHGTHERPGSAAQISQGVGNSVGSILDGIASVFERGLSGDGISQSDQEREARQDAPREFKPELSVLTDEEDRSKRRQELLREFGRELENEREADFERTRERERRGR